MGMLRGLFMTGLLGWLSWAGAMDIFSGTNVSMAVRQGQAFSWGDNRSGQLGNGAWGDVVTSPQAILGAFSPILAMAGGDRHSLALLGNGTVWAWGDNSDGQLGIDSSGEIEPFPLPVAVHDLTKVTAIAAGGNFSLALTKDGDVYTWGRGDLSGEQGTGSTGNVTSATTLGLAGPAVAIAAGHGHGLALLEDGSVQAWGNNGHGQLGDNTRQIRLAPVTVTGLKDIKAVSAGTAHSLALDLQGKVWGWGSNESGQLGSSSTPGIDAMVPVKIPLPEPIARIASGGRHNLALGASGRLYGWGSNDSGQVAYGGTPVVWMPRLITRAYTFEELQAIQDALARHQPLPPSPALSGIVGVAAGESHSMATDNQGHVWTWGGGSRGQLGRGATAPAAAAQTIPGW